MNFMNASRGRQFTTVFIVVLIFFGGFALGNQYAVGKAQSSDTAPPPGADKAFEPFWQVYNLIQSDYLNPVDTAALVDGATQGMVGALGDQYSSYMNPETYDLINSDLEGEFEGIGVVIHTNEDTHRIEVVSLLEGAPAATSGIKPGDIFAAVDGTDVTDMDQTQLATLVRGQEGTTVTITMQRGDKLIDFAITRAHITVPNTETRILDGDIAYVKLNQFTASARADLDAALNTVDVNHRSGLILDLRNNPGGLLSSAIEVASAFIQSGTVVTEDFGDSQHPYAANGDYADIQVPIAVLVNEGSASASELLAGALQDTGTATIIGAVTLGKGTVQTWHELVNGGGVRLTIARWLTPNGRWIHEQGVTPDIAVPWDRQDFTTNADDPQLEAAVSFLEGEPAAALISTPAPTDEATEVVTVTETVTEAVAP